MKIGYKLAAESFGPEELVRQAVLAEQAGFDFVEMSDHFHPWLDVQGHSPFAWTVLGAIAAKTERIGLATGVTCPTVRYHPAIIAQAAATLALLSDGRFTLGVGSGERLNEHVTGEGFPNSVAERHTRLREALEIIRLLWSGGYRSYDGRYLKLDDARVFDLPQELPEIAVAAGGPAAAPSRRRARRRALCHRAHRRDGGGIPLCGRRRPAIRRGPHGLGSPRAHRGAGRPGDLAVGSDRVEGDE